MHPNPYTALTYPKDYSPALDYMFKAFFISSSYIFPLHKGGVKMWETSDNTYMGLALSLAAKGEGRVNPNPLVGAVIVRDGAVIGQGYHAFFGGPHAERAALDSRAGQRGRALCHLRAMLPSWQNPALHGRHHKKRHPPGGHRRQ